jgi:hypothetical protein
MIVLIYAKVMHLCNLPSLSISILHRLNHFKGYTFLILGGILARAKDIKKKRKIQAKD